MMEETGLPSAQPEKPPHKRWGFLLMIPLLMSLIALFTLAMQWRGSLKLQRVVVEGSSAVSVKEIFALANVPMKTPLYLVDLAEVRERLMAQPFMKSVSVFRELPDRLSIQIVEREPVASINCGQLRYVDEEGVMLPNAESMRKYDLPLISGIDGIQKVQIGKTILNKDVFEAIAICRTAQSIDTVAYHMISEINMNNGGDIILYSADVGVPIILGHGDVAKKLIMLENFWNTFIVTGDVEKLKYIDLRFNDQVVVKWAHTTARHAKELSS